MNKPEDFCLATTHTNHFDALITDASVRLCFGEILPDRVTGQPGEATWTHAFLMSRANAERMAQAIMQALGDRGAQDFARPQPVMGTPIGGFKGAFPGASDPEKV